jgi:hypothetical protein
VTVKEGLGPTNYILTNLGVHILPLAFPCTLAISDDDWTKLPAFLGQDGSLVNENKIKASSVKLQAASCDVVAHVHEKFHMHNAA